jgi:hypothetical protein
MSSFLLPCGCGQRTPVSIAQAGQSIRCACGAQLEVPTLRGLKALPRAGEEQARTSRRPTWNNWHRVVFVLLVIALGSLAVCGYLATRLPSPVAHPSLDDISASMSKSSPAEIRQLYQDLSKGLPKIIGLGQSPEQRRQSLLWGIKVGLTIAAVNLVAAAIVALLARKQAR